MGNKRLRVSIDDTTDIEGRYVANVIISTLKIECTSQTFLFNAEVLKKQIIVLLLNYLTNL